MSPKPVAYRMQKPNAFNNVVVDKDIKTRIKSIYQNLSFTFFNRSRCSVDKNFPELALLYGLI